MSRYLVGEIEYNPRITVQPSAEIVDGGGDGRLQWLDVRDATTGEVTRRNAEGLFLLLGAEPHCDWLPDEVARDDRGFVLTGRDVPKEQLGRRPAAGSLETTVPGMFAVGDIRGGLDEAGRRRQRGGRQRGAARARLVGLIPRPAVLAGLVGHAARGLDRHQVTEALGEHDRVVAGEQPEVRRTGWSCSRRSG